MGKPGTRSKSSEKEEKCKPSEKTEDETEKLISKVCAKFSKELENNFSTNFKILNEKLEEVTITLKKMEHLVNANKSEINSLDRRCEKTEQYVKHNSIRINGLPEETDENLLDVILNFVNNDLKVPCTPIEIDYVYRVHNKAKGVKSVIINFVTNIKRNEVYSAKKLLKGSSIQIYENLTKYRYNLLTSAKSKYGKRAAWSMGGKVIVLDNNKKRVINCVEDI